MLIPQTSGYRMLKNDGNYLPGRIVAVDTETIPECQNAAGTKHYHRFRLGHIVSCHYRRKQFGTRVSLPITDPLQFWAYIDKLSGKRNTLWVVAHSALFDLVTLGIGDHIESGRYTLDAPRSARRETDDLQIEPVEKVLLAIDNNPFLLCLRCIKTQGRIVFVDTLNWFRSTLAELGDSLGIQKLRFPDFTESDEIWGKYCEQDVKICLEAFCSLIKWHSDNNLGVFRFTAASQALGSYRHRFAPRQIFFHDNGQCKKLERTGFIGGRTECFRIGLVDEPVYQLDVNSLYPSVMRNSRFPFILDAFDGSNLAKNIPNLPDWSACVAECDIIDAPPIYPFREGGLVCYPAGNFRTVLCGPELHHAISNGHVKTIGRYAIYKTAPLFTAFVDEFWAMRAKYKAEGNLVYAGLAKTILNSLFGKFAQKGYRWIECDDVIGGKELRQWYVPNWKRPGVTAYRSIGGRVFKESEPTERTDTLIAISAFVAAYGRCKMNEIRGIAGKQNVYYQGVDSVLVNASGRNRLDSAGFLSEFGLGGLRLNYCADTANIYNCNDYKIGSREVVSGRSAKFITGEDGKMKTRRMNATQSLFHRKDGNVMVERIVEWTRRNEYHKGTIGDGGWVEPLVF